MAMPLKVSVPVPSPSVIGFAAVSPVSTSGLPFTPAAPGWIWAARATVPAGNPDTCAEKFAVPGPVTTPALSRGTVMVIVAVPRASRSAFDTGGTSLLAANATVKTTGPSDGSVGLSPHAAPRIASAAMIAYRFMFVTPLQVDVDPIV